MLSEETRRRFALVLGPFCASLGAARARTKSRLMPAKKTFE
jgi:hypothetical protein